MATWVLKCRGGPDGYEYDAGPSATGSFWTSKKDAHNYRSRAEARKEQQRCGGADIVQVLRRGPSKYKVPKGMELVPCLVAVDVVARQLVKVLDRRGAAMGPQESTALYRTVDVLTADLAHWLAKVDEQRAAL